MSDRPDPPASRPSIAGGEAVAPPAEAPPAEAPPAPAGKDLVYVHGRTDDGALRIIRSREERLEIGEMRAPRQGQPILGELVQLHPTEDHDQLFECETLVAAPRQAAPRSTSGPAQVASPAYRSGWDLIFGVPADPSDLN